MTKRTAIIEIVTGLDIVVLFYTGVAKLMDYSKFKEQLTISYILGPAVEIAGTILPYVELSIVLMLLIPKWRIKGLYSCLTLMVLFTAYIIIGFTFNKDIACSCGGIIELLSWNQHLAFNTALITLNLWSIVLLKKQQNEMKKELSELGHLILSQQ